MVKAAERRAQIISRAIRLFAERGVDASLRAIGEALGVSHAALRYYFPTRDDLLVAVYREHEDAVRQSVPDDEALPAVASIDRSAERNRSIPGLVALYATLTTDALQEQDHPLTRAYIQERFAWVRADLARRIREAQEAGTVPADIDADDAAALVVAASDGLQIQWLLDPDAVDVRRSLAVLMRLVP